jgi:hypothetical protein
MRVGCTRHQGRADSEKRIDALSRNGAADVKFDRASRRRSQTRRAAIRLIVGDRREPFADPIGTTLTRSGETSSKPSSSSRIAALSRVIIPPAEARSGCEASHLERRRSRLVLRPQHRSECVEVMARHHGPRGSQMVNELGKL